MRFERSADEPATAGAGSQGSDSRAIDQGQVAGNGIFQRRHGHAPFQRFGDIIAPQPSVQKASRKGVATTDAANLPRQDSRLAKRRASRPFAPKRRPCPGS